MSDRDPYRTVRPAQTDDEIRALPDDDLDAHIRAGERYRDHAPPNARVEIDRRLGVARRERMRRADTATVHPLRSASTPR